MNIAMWSGPRNLSTALMYAFGARADCAVIDEPFYAAYLAGTGLDHPMRAEVLAAQPTDAGRVAAGLAAAPSGAALFYQKHMVQHLLPKFPRGWMDACVNVFLIRHPARVVASYARKREAPTPADLGFAQQEEIFDEVAARTGTAPVVIDSHTIRAAPEPALRALCAAIGIAFDPAMLRWPAGGHPADGVWARHWYGAVHRSTGFDAAEGPLPILSGPYAALAEAGLAAYERLAARALRP